MHALHVIVYSSVHPSFHPISSIQSSGCQLTVTIHTLNDILIPLSDSFPHNLCHLFCYLSLFLTYFLPHYSAIEYNKVDFIEIVLFSSFYHFFFSRLLFPHFSTPLSSSSNLVGQYNAQTLSISSFISFPFLPNLLSPLVGWRHRSTYIQEDDSWQYILFERSVNIKLLPQRSQRWLQYPVTRWSSPFHSHLISSLLLSCPLSSILHLNKAWKSLFSTSIQTQISGLYSISHRH